jgi:hypothetical protein
MRGKGSCHKIKVFRVSCCTDSEKTVEIPGAGSSVQDKTRHNSDKNIPNYTLSVNSTNLEPKSVNLESEPDRIILLKKIVI